VKAEQRSLLNPINGHSLVVGNVDQATRNLGRNSAVAQYCSNTEARDKLTRTKRRVAAITGSFYKGQAMSNIVSGRQIRAARMLAGLTQADLARAAGGSGRHKMTGGLAY
jgi:hypothetical protein